jgi:predicted nucleotidyltransferase
LLETYTDAGNGDRLYEEAADEVELVGFDAVLAGAYLLGKDAQRTTASNIRNKLGPLYPARTLQRSYRKWHAL